MNLVSAPSIITTIFSYNNYNWHNNDDDYNNNSYYNNCDNINNECDNYHYNDK